MNTCSTLIFTLSLTKPAPRSTTHIGQLMANSRGSTRDDFEITCPQVDALVVVAKEVIGESGGVRMTGGGFGGCVVSLVPYEPVNPVRTTISARYPAATGLQGSIYVCHASAGAGVCV